MKTIMNPVLLLQIKWTDWKKNVIGLDKFHIYNIEFQVPIFK